MLGGLSLYAVVTGVITSALVARAQADSAIGQADPVMEKLDELDRRLEEIKSDVARLGPTSG